MADKNFKVKTGLTLPSPLPVDQGGTGQTTTSNTLNSLLPSQAGNANKVLSTDGTNTSFITLPVAYARGGTASRPASPAVGDIFYNTDTNVFEQYVSAGWFAIAAPPGVVTAVTATNQGSGRAFNNGQASVAFAAGTTGGASSSFTITPSPSTSPSTFSGTSSPITVTNLASSTQYTYTATATSPYGTAAASAASAGVTATTVPQAPTIGAPTQDTATSISVPFTAASTGGSAITGFTVTSSPHGLTASGASSPLVVTGLTNGTEYTFTAVATNANGTSAASAASSAVTAAAPFPDTATFALVSHQSLSSNQTGVTFSNINPKYTDLYLVMHASTDYNGAKDQVMMKFNSDSSASNYTTGYNGADGVVGSLNGLYSRFTNISGIRMPGLFGSTATNSLRGVVEVDLINFSNTSDYKTILSKFGAQDLATSGYNVTVGQSSGSWRNSAAVSSIQLTPTLGSNFTTNSTFSLFGVTRSGGYGS